MRSKRKTFTLIELMVVMVVMGMLVTLALPSFNRMINGNKVDQLASQLKLAMEQAQSRAITNRRHVALILPNRKLKGDKKNEFGGYRMAFVKFKGKAKVQDENTGVKNYPKGWYFVSWLPDSAWKPAIPGAKLIKTADSNESDYNEFVTTKGDGLPVEEKIANIDYLGLKDIKEYDGGSSAKPHCAIIFSPYGGIAGGYNIRLAVTEAEDNGTAFIFPSRNATGPTNFRTLEVNRFTGRVKHFAN